MNIYEHPVLVSLAVWATFCFCALKGTKTLKDLFNSKSEEGFVAFLTLLLSFILGGMVSIGSFKNNTYGEFLAGMLALSVVIVAVRITYHYRNDMKRWFCFRKEQFQKWHERRRNISDVKNIYRESRVPPKTKAKLGEAIAEWEESKRKLPLLAASLKNLEAEFVRMDKALAQAKAAQAKKQLDADITESYTAIVSDLSEQREKLRLLIAEVKKEIAVRKERMVMIADFFRDIPEQAEVYTDYDKFTAETMKLQKDLKETIVKVPKNREEIQK